MTPQNTATENYSNGWDIWHKRTKLQKQIHSFYLDNEAMLGDNADSLKQAGEILGNSGYSHAKRWDKVSELIGGLQLSESENKYFRDLSSVDRKYLTEKSSNGIHKRNIKDLVGVVSEIRGTRNSVNVVEPESEVSYEDQPVLTDYPIVHTNDSVIPVNAQTSQKARKSLVGKVAGWGLGIAASLVFTLGAFGQAINSGIDYLSQNRNQNNIAMVASAGSDQTLIPQIEAVEREEVTDEIPYLAEMSENTSQLPINPGEDPNFLEVIPVSGGLAELVDQSEDLTQGTVSPALGESYSRLNGTEEVVVPVPPIQGHSRLGATGEPLGADAGRAALERSEAYWTNVMVVNAPTGDKPIKTIEITDVPNERNILDIIFGAPERTVTFTETSTEYSHLNGFDIIDNLREFGVIGAEYRRLCPFLGDREGAAQAFEDFARNHGAPEWYITQAENGRTDVTENDFHILYSQARWNSLNDSNLPETSRGLIGSMETIPDEENPEDSEKETRITRLTGGATEVDGYREAHRK
jgi:hypothetical protein